MPRKNIKRDFLRDCRRNNYDDRIQYKIAFTCFHIISGTAPPYLSELLHLYSPSLSLRSASDIRIFRVPRVCKGDFWGEILSVYRICHLELTAFLSLACHVTLFFQVKTENQSLLFCQLIYRFLSSVSTIPMTTMLVFLRVACVCVGVGGGICVCVCACVCLACVRFEINVLKCFCKHPRLS